MFALYKRETISLFSSPIAYLVISVYLIISGLFLWVFPQTSILKGSTSELTAFFSLSPYLLIFLASAICMRSFSEERREGTLELLLTKPFSEWAVVLAKFLSCFTVILVALLLTSVYYVSVYKLGSPVGNIDSASVVGSYIGLLLLAMVFCAIGVASSVLTANQLVALLVSAILSYLLYDGFNSIAQLSFSGEIGYTLSRLGIDYHYFALSRGALDIGSAFYLSSMIVFFLALCHLILRSRHWE